MIDRRVEALAKVLYEVSAQRGAIDLDATDRAFGGGAPFREVAAAILEVLDAAGWQVSPKDVPEQPPR